MSIGNACIVDRDISSTIAKSKMELFVTIVNGWKSSTFVTKNSILDSAVALDKHL